MSSTVRVERIAGKGRGVVATRNFEPGEVVERAPVIVLPEDPYDLLNRTTLKDYYLAWGDNAIAIGLGYSSLYNHSETPNAQTRRLIDQHTIEIVAIRPIAAGEEVTFLYACEPWWEHRREQVLELATA